MPLEPARWAEVHEIAGALDANRLPATDELGGRSLTLAFTDGRVVRYTLHDGASLTYELLAGDDVGARATERYEAVRVAPDVYLVAYFSKNNPRESTTIALDLGSRRATVVVGTMPTLSETKTDLIARMKSGFDLSPVKVELLHAAIDPVAGAAFEPHAHTTDLVGKRVRYTYGDGGVYEHIYLNEHLYTWHCLAGPERGLADTERCDTVRISPDVILFTWHEKIVPTLGVVLVNTRELRSTGILTGIDTVSGAPVYCGIGAVGELMNVTPTGPA